jgi:hypothetical protein
MLGCALAAGGCEHFAVNPFAGSKIQLTMTGADPTPPGHHLELWARNGDQDIVRLLAGSAPDSCLNNANACTNSAGYSPTLSGYAIVSAVDIGDPCMIDGTGNLLWSPDAQSGATDADRLLQAQAVEKRIHELTDLQPKPLLALVSYDDGAAQRPVRAPDQPSCTKLGKPCIPDDATAPTRLGACLAFWSQSPFAYTGSPLQLTRPVHGTLFGMLDFASITPAQTLGGIQVISDFALRDLRELWFTEPTAKVATLDPDQIDCKAAPDTCRGALFLQGNAGPAQNGIFRFDLSSPQGTVSGTASVLTRLDEDPVQF